jgi:hypothetical protein
MATGLERNKHLNRPRKSESRKLKRRGLHIKRLVALGLTQEKAAHLDSKQIRTLLRKPKKTAALAAKKKA